MTKPLDAAIRAACTDCIAYECGYPDCEVPKGCATPRIARAAIRAALPVEFDAEKEALMRKAYGDAARTGSNPHLAVYRALRAYLLGEDQ